MSNEVVYGHQCKGMFCNNTSPITYKSVLFLVIITIKYVRPAKEQPFNTFLTPILLFHVMESNSSDNKRNNIAASSNEGAKQIGCDEQVLSNPNPKY